MTEPSSATRQFYRLGSWAQGLLALPAGNASRFAAFGNEANRDGSATTSKIHAYYRLVSQKPDWVSHGIWGRRGRNWRHVHRNVCRLYPSSHRQLCATVYSGRHGLPCWVAPHSPFKSAAESGRRLRRAARNRLRDLGQTDAERRERRERRTVNGERRTANALSYGGGVEGSAISGNSVSFSVGRASWVNRRAMLSTRSSARISV